MLKETYDAALAMRTAVYAMRAALRVESDRAVNPSLWVVNDSMDKVLQYADRIVALGDTGGWDKEVPVTQGVAREDAGLPY